MVSEEKLRISYHIHCSCTMYLSTSLIPARMCLPYLRSLAQWLLHPLSLGHFSVSLPELSTSATNLILCLFPTFVDNTHTVIRILQQAWIAVLTRFLPSNGLYVPSPISSSFAQACSLSGEAGILTLRETNRTGTAADLAVVVGEVTNSADANPEMITLAMVSERYVSTHAFQLPRRIELTSESHPPGALPPPLPLNMRLPS